MEKFPERYEKSGLECPFSSLYLKEIKLHTYQFIRPNETCE